MKGVGVKTADRAERESIRRFETRLHLRRVVSDAARQADAYARLEYALRYESSSAAAAAFPSAGHRFCRSTFTGA
jgi:hypothetical protein